MESQGHRLAVQSPATLSRLGTNASILLPPILSATEEEGDAARAERAATRYRSIAQGLVICYGGAFTYSPTKSAMVAELVDAVTELRNEVDPKATLRLFLGHGTKGCEAGSCLADRSMTPLFEKLINGRIPGVLAKVDAPHDEVLYAYKHICSVGVRGLRLRPGGVKSNQTRFDVNEDESMSTKVVEMFGTGLPVVLNPYKVHQLLLGYDYPLYWSDANDHTNITHAFVALMADLLRSPNVYSSALEKCQRAAQWFSFPTTLARVIRLFPSPSRQMPKNSSAFASQCGRRVAPRIEKGTTRRKGCVDGTCEPFCARNWNAKKCNWPKCAGCNACCSATDMVTATDTASSAEHSPGPPTDAGR